jgi:hypothetical protein
MKKHERPVPSCRHSGTLLLAGLQEPRVAGFETLGPEPKRRDAQQ